EVEALLLLDPPWYGLWPLRLASRLGKPVLFCPAIAHLTAENEALLRAAEGGEVPILAALTLRHAPILEQLRELLRGSLGPVRLVVGSCTSREPVSGTQARSASPGLFELLDSCDGLFEA